MSTALKPLRVAALASGMLVATAGLALADCKVTNSDEKGFFGGDKTYTRTFSGTSAKTIWDNYCKPFIQSKIAENDIQNGKLGMHCTGRVRCDIRGIIVNGQVELTKQRFN